jgi:hypothetical protein
MVTMSYPTAEDVLVRVTLCVYFACQGGKITCAFHIDKPLGHDGCDDVGMPCTGCSREAKPPSPGMVRTLVAPSSLPKQSRS